MRPKRKPTIGEYRKLRKKFIAPQQPLDINTLLSPKKHTYDDEKILRYKTKITNMFLWKKYFKARYDVCTSNAGLMFSKYDGKMKIDFMPKFRKHFKKCKNRFFVDFIFIASDISDTGHANCLFIDKQFRKIYHFEPNGISLNKKFLQIADFIEDLLETLPKYDIFKGYSVIHSMDMCPYVGPQYVEHNQREEKNQKIQGEANGYCIVWSMMFLHYCITNPNADPSDIIAHLLSKTNLVDILRRYVAYLVDTVGIDEEPIDRKQMRKTLKS